jgi:hypothetical protein
VKRDVSRDEGVGITGQGLRHDPTINE